jgi:MYXO-CTERM domain-containing protein
MSLSAGISAAQADIVVFDLTAGNSAISGFAGPYAAVTVNRTSSTTATITFASLTAGGISYLMGGQGAVGVNVNASSWTLGTITGSNSGTGFTPGPWSSGGAGNEDGWGSFNQTVDSFDGYGHSSDTISFGLTDTSGTWASAANVLGPNASGYEAASHIFVTTSPANASNSALNTGYATGSVTAAPEPSTWAMGLMGFFGLGYAAFRRTRRESVSAFA